ncbi:hypothetical protein ES703_73892 [subsurface metagenome]
MSTNELPTNQLFCGDAAELTRELIPDNSIHAIVTDPPYGLEFMGEEWDKFGGKPNPKGEYDGAGGMERYFKGNKPIYGWSSSELLNYQKWTTSWAKEALRVLKPGASMLVMGGTRTYHRMVCGVEDAGFIIKDCLAWCYNSGFPKAQDLGTMIDKRQGKIKIISGESKSIEFSGKFDQRASSERPKYELQTDLAKKWDGWKVGGLKPAYEPVLWAVKPPDGAYIDNVLKHGVGAINVDGCRIPYENKGDFEDTKRQNFKGGKGFVNRDALFLGGQENTGIINPQGRYPANMILTDPIFDGDCLEVVKAREKPAVGHIPSKTRDLKEYVYAGGWKGRAQDERYFKTESFSRFYLIPKAGRAERWFKCKVCDVCQDGTHLRDHDDHALHCHECGVDFPNTEESRKAHKEHKTESNIIAHPTVKPVSLGEHLIKLVTREGQIVADFFAGLGSFPEAARRQNRHYIGFDNNPEYIEIAKHRLAAIPRPLEAYSERIEV